MLRRIVWWVAVAVLGSSAFLVASAWLSWLFAEMNGEETDLPTIRIGWPVPTEYPFFICLFLPLVITWVLLALVNRIWKYQLPSSADQ